MRISRLHLRKIIGEELLREQQDDFYDLEPERFTGRNARKHAEDAAVDLVFDEPGRGDAVHVVSLGGGEYGLYFAYRDGEDYYEDQPGSDPEAETVIQVPRGRAIQYGPRRDWGGSRVKPGRH